MKTNKYDIRLDEDRLPILVRECAVFYKQRMTHDCPEAVADWLRERLGMGSAAREVLAVMVYDTKGVLIGMSTPFEGTVNMSPVSPRDIFQLALALGGSYVIVAHNHPSGDETPSGPDLAVMEKVRAAGELMDVQLMDFIIVGRGYWSAGQEGLLERKEEKR